MKPGENRLLNKLQREDHYSTSDEPLANVKNALGSIAYAKGNPLTKTEITIQVTSVFRFEGAGGGVIAPAALPLAAQTSLPFYLFGLTDYYSSFPRALNICAPTPIWDAFSFIGGEPAFGIFGFTRNAIVGAIPAQIGDLILSYRYFLAAGSYSCTIIVHCNNVAYGTFLNSFVSDLITISVMRYIVPIANVNQFINPLVFVTQSLFGKVATDTIDPRMYITSKDFQQQISDIPVNLPIDKNVIVCSQLSVFCQQLSFVLFVEKVEPLTHKKL